MKAMRFFFALTVLATSATVAMAQDGAGSGRHRGGGGMFGRNPLEVLQSQFKKLDLTDDQKAKIDPIIKEYEPKIKDALKSFEGILTEEQKKARNEAMKAARDSGDWKSVRDAVTLTDEQKTKREEAGKALSGLVKEMRDKVLAELTQEQKEKLAKMRGPGGRGGFDHRPHGDHDGGSGDGGKGSDSENNPAKPNEA